MAKVRSVPCRTPEELLGAEAESTVSRGRGRGRRSWWETLTAVDGQVDVAVLRSQDVGGGAAVQARRLGRHVGDLDGAREVT